MSKEENKTNLSPVEPEVARDTMNEALSDGNSTVRLNVATGRNRAAWNDHLSKAIPSKGRSAHETISYDREGRW